MEKFFRNKQELVFWTAAIVIFILLLIYAVFLVRFLVKQFRAASDPNLLKQQEIVKFNLGKVQQLKTR